MEVAPNEVVQAVLKTLHYAMTYCRNYSSEPNAQIAQVNELMEAIHDLPSKLLYWRHDGLGTIKLHLEGFDHSKWPGSPNLGAYFRDSYQNATENT